jgi:hypothetical protein
MGETIAESTSRETTFRRARVKSGLEPGLTAGLRADERALGRPGAGQAGRWAGLAVGVGVLGDVGQVDRGPDPNCLQVRGSEDATD